MPAIGLSKEESDIFLECKEDFPKFCEKILKLEMKPFHRKMVNLLLNNRKVCLVCSRGHGKSEFFTVAYPLWVMSYQNDRKIMLISANLDQSKKLLMRVQEFIRKNKYLSHLIPDNPQDAWNKNELYTGTGCHYFIKPFSSSIRGSHVHYCICDDILKDENSTHQQIIELYQDAIIPTVASLDGQIVVVGTPITSFDLISYLGTPDMRKIYKWAAFPACKIDDENNIIDPIWPERFPVKKLEELRIEGRLAFARNYLCNPVGSYTSIFPEDIIKGAMKVPIQLAERVEDTKFQYYMGYDLALSGAKGADYSVFAIIERSPDGMLKLVRMERYKGMASDLQVRRVVELYHNFKFTRILVEHSPIAMGIIESLEAIDELRGIIKKWNPSHHNKEKLISRLESQLRSGELALLRNDVLYQELMNFAVVERRGRQRLEGTGEHDDCVIALGLASQAALRPKLYFGAKVR